MLIKLNLEKAYGRLSLEYLGGILKAHKFDERWVEWILSMVSTPVMLVMLNGTPFKAFNPTRGLRQGDPLSPFLFILATEGLGRQVKARLANEQLKGLRICGNELPITHQQFVDDVMFYGQASLKEAQHILKIIFGFTKASRTEINNE